MQLEIANNICYEWYLTGPEGARFILYPIKDVHSVEDIMKAKVILKRDHDVMSIQVKKINLELCKECGINLTCNICGFLKKSIEKQIYGYDTTDS